MGKRRNDLEIMNWIPQITLQIQNSDQSPLYDVRNHARKVCEDNACEVMFRGRFVGVDSRPVFALRATTLQPSHRRLAEPKLAQPAKAGGARRDRTDDLMLAKHALSQLSYGPLPEDECLRRS